MHHSIETIRREIALSLGYDPEHPPEQLDAQDAAAVLGVKLSTLSHWRSTGRYNLRFRKVGRLVRYRVTDLAEFLALRTSDHAG